MSDYPEALLLKVAGALNAELEVCQSDERCPKHERYLMDLATAALDALGLREEFGWEATDPVIEMTYMKIKGAGEPTHRRFILRTDWEDA